MMNQVSNFEKMKDEGTNMKRRLTNNDEVSLSLSPVLDGRIFGEHLNEMDRAAKGARRSQHKLLGSNSGEGVYFDTIPLASSIPTPTRE